MRIFLFFCVFFVAMVVEGIIGFICEYGERLKEERYYNVTYTTKERRLKDGRAK